MESDRYRYETERLFTKHSVMRSGKKFRA